MKANFAWPSPSIPMRMRPRSIDPTRVPSGDALLAGEGLFDGAAEVGAAELASVDVTAAAVAGADGAAASQAATVRIVTRTASARRGAMRILRSGAATDMSARLADKRPAKSETFNLVRPH
jgi:hypothetical protein